MPETDYYPKDEAAPDESGGAEDMTEKEDSESEDQTFLVPKGALGGKQIEPGKRCEFEVVHEYEDEVEFKYVPHGDRKNSSMSDADEMIDNMGGESEAEGDEA